MTDLRNLLDQIDRLDQQATKGPWVVDKDNPRGIHDPLVIYPPEDDGGVIAYVQPDQDDAEFIALARTALPSLSKALRAVLDAHQRLDMTEGHEPRYICATCTAIGKYGNWDQVEYPCGTVQAITHAIGVDHE